MSFTHPLSCGFAKVAAFEISVKAQKKSGDLREDYRNFVNFFEGFDSFNIDYESFIKKRKKINEDIFTLGKKSKVNKENLLKVFSSNEWKQLKKTSKLKHSISKCNGCLANDTYRGMLSKLPCKNNVFRKEAEEAGLYKKILKDITNEIVNCLNQVYKKEYNTTFTKSLNLTTSTPDRNGIIKEVKEFIEKEWEETAVDRYDIISQNYLHLAIDKIYRNIHQTLFSANLFFQLLSTKLFINNTLNQQIFCKYKI